MNSYNFGILPFAGMLFLMSILAILWRRRIARASNGFYKGAGLDRLVFNESSLSKGMVVSGAIMALIGMIALVSGCCI